MTNELSLGEYLRNARRHLRLTQADVGKAVNRCTNVISRIEKGHKSVGTVDFLSSLVEYYERKGYVFKVNMFELIHTFKGGVDIRRLEYKEKILISTLYSRIASKEIADEELDAIFNILNKE